MWTIMVLVQYSNGMSKDNDLDLAINEAPIRSHRATDHWTILQDNRMKLLMVKAG